MFSGMYDGILDHFMKENPVKRDPWSHGGSLDHWRGWQRPQPKKTKHQMSAQKAKHVREIMGKVG